MLSYDYTLWSERTSARVDCRDERVRYTSAVGAHSHILAACDSSATRTHARTHARSHARTHTHVRTHARTHGKS